ncbi:MAG: bifunctional folylpolyglutamate synthase/dihydrofolate synthase [Wujia sp.]
MSSDREVNVMDYTMAMNYIEGKNKLGIVPGLDNIKELLRRLGNPQNSVKCMHIAGTNGKGSIFSFVEDILICAGYKVGRYISPTIFSYLERFQINKVNMSEECFCHILSEVSAVVENMVQEKGVSPTAFEIETAIAFLYFKKNNVDFMLIECGMGGALDATNVMEKPLVSVMASVSLDHMQFLGDSISLITDNKAAIIKDHGLCVSYPQCEEAGAELEKKCAEKHAELDMVKRSEVDIIKQELLDNHFIYKGHEYCITLSGEHQIYNAATAIEIIHALNKKNVFSIEISDEVMENAIAKTNWPGRLTKIHDAPIVMVDGAHNEEAWKLLAAAVNKYFTNRRIIYIIGVLRDKEYNKMIDILKDSMSYAITVTPDNARALDKETLRELIVQEGIAAEMADNAETALTRAMSIAGADGVVMVCGSLSFIAEYLNFFSSKNKNQNSW